MADSFNLQRFVDAQDAVFADVLAELTTGTKQSHWMWFIFPQLRGLGLSATAQYYGLTSLDEACAFLDHPVLGPRLDQSLDALLACSGKRTAQQILGPIDALKLRSSLTLFDQAKPDSNFAQALAAFCDDQRDPRTLALLAERP